MSETNFTPSFVSCSGINIGGTQVLTTQVAAVTFTAATSNVETEITNMSNAIVALIAAMKSAKIMAT